MISTNCVPGACAKLEIHQEKCCESMHDMYLVTHEINDAILGLLSEEVMQKYLYQKRIKSFKCENISKFTIFLSMFSDGYRILLQTLSKFKQIN